ncbi:hypothetical protein DV515_00008706 [Chloebia gouldiae]|uniref:Uncharacterized protein n=1 Tax=Chloebia gouldiae TaxID=44316 RepID=A0A3L8SE70_CHLGU|nr:hypothetical protein DV515_00008706 [Chloebia gouldiae]
MQGVSRKARRPAPMALLKEPPTDHLTFLVVPLLPVQKKPGIPWQGGEAAGSTPRQAAGMFPWGWDPTGEEEGRMEFPLGGQFQNTVWDEPVGKEDFTQPPL